MERLKTLVRDIPDFPATGILFRDITPLLRDPRGFAEVIDLLASEYRSRGVDLVAGIESRGFLFGAPLALELGVGFVPLRKLGKLPAPTLSRSYALEYGANHLEMHRDAVERGQRVLLVDDVLATGGTARAGAEMIDEVGGNLVGAAFVIEIGFLNGRKALGGCEVFSLLRY